MSDTETVQEKSTAKVWVFIVDTDHGTNVSVHPTREEADGANYEYCDEWWHREFGDQPRPADGELVAAYWDRQSDRGSEWHLITECDLSGVRLIPDGVSELQVVGDETSACIVPTDPMQTSDRA